MANTGIQPMTTGNSIESLSFSSEDTNLSPTTETPPHEWFATLPTSENVRRRRLTHVSQDPKYNHWGLSAADGEAECTATRRRIPDWGLRHGETQMLFEAGHGTTLDLIYT